MIAVTADQRRSRTSEDGVPAALAALHDVHVALTFERTAGDEIQGLLTEASAVLDVVERLTRVGEWRLGIGIGTVDTPLPGSTREARGPAYIAARTAIEDAHRSPTGLALRLSDAIEPSGTELSGTEPSGTVGGVPYGDPQTLATDVEAAMWLLRTLWERRSEEGWELVDLLDDGHTNASAAATLGISASAASQRLSRAHLAESTRGRLLAEHLLEALLASEAR